MLCSMQRKIFTCILAANIDYKITTEQKYMQSGIFVQDWEQE